MTTLAPSELSRLRQMIGFTPEPGIDPFTGRPPRASQARRPAREFRPKTKRPDPSASKPVAPGHPFFKDSNTRRSQESASRDVGLAQEALASDIEFTETQCEILLARVDYPYDSVSELGQRIGRSKDSVAGVLRQVRRKINHHG